MWRGARVLDGGELGKSHISRHDLIGSSTTASPVKGKVSGKAEGAKRAVSLTPPTEIEPAQLAAARKRVQYVNHLRC